MSQQSGIHTEVEIEVDGDRLIIRAVTRLRLGWDEVFAAMAERYDDVLLDDINTTDCDRVRARASKINNNKWTKVQFSLFDAKIRFFVNLVFSVDKK
ncbi:hypothetical protein OGM63_00720 [Plectonema radiosum NIES-515]|uniref:Uncharacterized protein n=1 Tax=Plectonema radiosum NIES-515 TaxID=2986073 RepID=A0ABT3ASH4_9CYAN|nr:hypothetical protein [Plectonema radiosum]MCV3212059.1 hypothetical protein [Plectonema radiosum NIES-515]